MTDPVCTPWTVKKAKVAVNYHIRLLGHLLEKLDLPFVYLQELKLGLKRSSVAGAPTNCNANWQISPWGAIFLALEPKCPPWRHQLEPESGAEWATLPELASFSCISSEEASFISEFEVHVFAVLCHVSRAAQEGLPTTRTSRIHAPCVTDGKAKVVGVEAKYRVAFNPPSRTAGVNVAKPSDAFDTITGEQVFGDLDVLVDFAWAFFLRMHLVDALLRGRVSRAAGWAVRMLGISEPWGLRRLQDLVLHVLETLVEQPSIEADGFFCEGCAAYLAAPFIPRFRPRVSRALACLTRGGLLSCPGSVSEAPPSSQGKLEQVVGQIVAEEGNREFHAEDLKSLRASDGLYVAFRAKLLDAASRGHLDMRGVSEVRGQLCAGAEIVCALRSGGPWPEEKRTNLLDTISSLPDARRDASSDCGNRAAAMSRDSEAREARRSYGDWRCCGQTSCK